MHRTRSPFHLLVGALLVACGGDGSEEAAAEADATESAPAVTAEAGDLQGCYLQRGTMEEALSRPSPLTELGLVYEGGAGLLCYGAPSANDREVMGALVPFDEPWRVGANEATAIHLTAPASLGGVDLDPGSYSLYAVPGADEWQFFVSSNFERWGIPIDESVRSAEVGSFTATPEAAEEMVETMTFRFEPNDENTMGDIVLEWENTRVRFHLHPGGA